MAKEEIKNQIINANGEFFLTCLYKLTAGLRYSGNIYEALMLEFGDKGSQEITRRIDEAKDKVSKLTASLENINTVLSVDPGNAINKKIKPGFEKELKSKKKYLKNLKQDLRRHKRGNEDDLAEFASFMRKYVEKFTDSADNLGEINDTLVDIIDESVEKSTFFNEGELNIVKYKPVIMIPIKEYAEDHKITKAKVIEKSKAGELTLANMNKKRYVVE